VNASNRLLKSGKFLSLVFGLVVIALVALYSVHSGMFLYTVAWLLAWPVLVFDIESFLPRLMVVFVMQLVNAVILYLIYRLIFRLSSRKNAIK
jgi:hypothetical protein